MKTVFTFLVVAGLVFVAQAYFEDERCDDALKEHTGLCKRYADEGHCARRKVVRDFCQRSCGQCNNEKRYYRQGYRREYIDNIDALLLGEQKRKIIKSPEKKEKKRKLIIPDNREWNFMDWIRKYDSLQH
ncbi:uncharacterized protein LOC110239073 [Exaiptasia diaphana]|uniref:ShKT domain-containing protein n=1 Tax=Exaiptasia diaphana TaxID=2652724 RepID=A0A913X819_EXADI|nr:uncharacterized protein LOC110239073 [Exaiptasia diaphana]KXJ14292.1 hypothetical protein AC249_AIPGENE5970 [Exaiptasia diaphana]